MIIAIIFFSFAMNSWAQTPAAPLSIAGPFLGLNDTDSPITLNPGETQSTLNVEVSQDGLALKKRAGYSLLSSLTVATSPVTGSVIFKDSSGNTIKIFAHDQYLSRSINGSVFTNIVTTATLNAKWSFCVSNGIMYGFNDQNDIPLSYNGTTVIYHSTIPYASVCAITADRMLLAGTTDFPNRLYFSQSGSILNFTVGTAPEDPGFEDIGLSGEKITNIFTTQSEWLVFKSNSFISYQGSNQFDLIPSIISHKIGMNDPHAILQHEGIVYFKASDGKIWGYAGGSLTEISEKISSFIEDITKDETTTALYTDKEHFDSGVYLYSTGSITSGSVEPVRYTTEDTTTADFNAGVLGSSTTVYNNSFYLNINQPITSSWTARTAPATNAWNSVAYSSSSIWAAVSSDGTNRVMTTTNNGLTWTAQTAAEANYWTAITYGNNLWVAVSADGIHRVMTSVNGSTWIARTAIQSSWSDVVYNGSNLYVAVANAGTNRVMTSADAITWTATSAAENNSWQAIAYNGTNLYVAVANSGTNRMMTSANGTTWTAVNIPTNQWMDIVYGNGMWVAVAQSGSNRILTSPDGVTWTARTSADDSKAWNNITYGQGLFVATSEILGTTIMTSPDGITWTSRTCVNNSWYAVNYGNYGFVAVSINSVGGLAQVQTSDYVAYTTSSTFTSRPQEIATSNVSSQTYYGYITYTSSVPTGTQIDFFSRHSRTSGGAYTAWAATTDYLLISSTDTYYEYRVDLYKTTSTLLGPTVYDVQLLFKTTGYWETPEVSMGAMGAWGQFTATSTLDAAATLNYRIYVATFSGGTASAAAQTITPGTNITASTGTFSKVRAFNTFTTATETVRLHDITWSWSITPDALANAFEYKGNIYFSVPYNSSINSNRILKFDLQNKSWNVFNIACNSAFSLDNYVYFGSPTTGNVYQYPSGTSDAGTAINSYWKSKDFMGNPFVDKQYQKISIVAGADYGSTLNLTYMTDTVTATTYNVSLTTTTASFVRDSRALPMGTRGAIFSLQVGNNSSTPWTFFGANIDYKDNPWRVIP